MSVKFVDYLVQEAELKDSSRKSRFASLNLLMRLIKFYNSSTGYNKECEIKPTTYNINYLRQIKQMLKMHVKQAILCPE